MEIDDVTVSVPIQITKDLEVGRACSMSWFILALKKPQPRHSTASFDSPIFPFLD